MAETQTLAERFRETDDAIIDLAKAGLYLERMSAITDTLFLGIVPQLIAFGMLQPRATDVIHDQLSSLLDEDILPRHKQSTRQYLDQLAKFRAQRDTDPTP